MSKIYCPIPWMEVHINADGTYHSCGAQPNCMTGSKDQHVYNVMNMSIKDWMLSAYQQTARNNKLNDIADPLCELCYQEERIGKSSKRKRELDKYPVIPIHFQQEIVTKLPTSYHVSIGNECNLACKICKPVHSSRIAAEDKRLGLWSGPVKQNWTEDERAWNMVLDTMIETEDLEFVHIIGGEPLLNPRFEQMVDRFLDAGKTNIYLGFTTNGTILNQRLFDKLSQFRHADIGISIEAVDQFNNLIRSGSDTDQVLKNIDEYLKYRKEGQVYVTLRTVPSALSVHTMDQLFRWCIDRRLDIMSQFLVKPTYQAINQLPQTIKERLKQQFNQWEFINSNRTGNDRDPNLFREHIDNEVRAILRILDEPNDPVLTETLYQNLKNWGWFDNPEIRKYFF